MGHVVLTVGHSLQQVLKPVEERDVDVLDVATTQAEVPLEQEIVEVSKPIAKISVRVTIYVEAKIVDV